MNYELAKELEDNGFPIPKKRPKRYDAWIASDNKFLGIEHNREDAINSCYNPTLEELIEACGDRFSSLEKTRYDWIAFEKQEVKPEVGDIAYEILPVGIAESPKEAVAHLLLSISNGNIKEWISQKSEKQN